MNEAEVQAIQIRAVEVATAKFAMIDDLFPISAKMRELTIALMGSCYIDGQLDMAKKLAGEP